MLLAFQICDGSEQATNIIFARLTFFFFFWSLWIAMLAELHIHSPPKFELSRLLSECVCLCEFNAAICTLLEREFPQVLLFRTFCFIFWKDWQLFAYCTHWYCRQIKHKHCLVCTILAASLLFYTNCLLVLLVLLLWYTENRGLDVWQVK